jgi:hypothetical protein
MQPLLSAFEHYTFGRNWQSAGVQKAATHSTKRKAMHQQNICTRPTTYAYNQIITERYVINVLQLQIAKCGSMTVGRILLHNLYT